MEINIKFLDGVLLDNAYAMMADVLCHIEHQGNNRNPEGMVLSSI